MVNGIEGLLQDKFLNLSEIFTSKEELDRLTQTPAMYLGSCRFKLPTCEHSEDVYEDLFNFFAFLVINSFSSSLQRIVVILFFLHLSVII